MISSLNTYPEYRDSGTSELGRVPSHWQLRSLGSLATSRSERGRPELPLLSVVRDKGVIARSLSGDDENHNVIPDDLSNYKVVRTGDLVINKMKAWQGSLGIAQQDGLVSPAYFVFDLPLKNPRYAHSLLRSRPYVAFFGRASDGVRVGQWDLSIPAMKRVPVLIPPADEQDGIARFLDHADRRIRRYIRAKDELIGFLRERIVSITEAAVTRGLDLSVGTKPSGMESLACVPFHWSIMPFTRCAIERADYRGATPAKTESGAFLVTAKNVRKGTIDYAASREFVSQDEYNKIMRRGLPRAGDLLLTTEAPLGNAALVDREDVALAQRVIRFRMDGRIIRTRFALSAVLSRYFQDQLTCRATGSTALGIKASKLPQLRIAVPPLEEQDEILLWIDGQTSPLHDAVRRAQREIALVTEYRARLQADVVTGKLDVRSAAAMMPMVDENSDEYASDSIEADEDVDAFVEAEA